MICLNVGVDPPDVTKTVPCARQECWVDPLSLNTQRALETIGANLQRQYERWQPRARSVVCSRAEVKIDISCHSFDEQTINSKAKSKFSELKVVLCTLEKLIQIWTRRII